jgi:diguanylate cyclase (GGDEF)-like protein
MERSRSSHQRWRLAPFVAAAALPYVLLAFAQIDWGSVELLAAALLTVLVAASAVGVPWARLPRWTHVLPALAYVVAVALLRDGASGSSAGVAPVVLLPVFWLALYGTRGHLAVVLGEVLTFFVLPVLVIGSPAYPVSGIRAGILFVAVAAIMGVTVQSLVSRVRAQQRERDDLLKQLDALAHTDELTALPNRRAWSAELERAITRARDSGRPLTIAALDLDNFKAFNDSFGHDHGDRLLTQAAASWRQHLRPDDIIARLGGDEFALILPDCAPHSARPVLGRLLRHTPVSMTCSIGVAVWNGSESGHDVLARADRALYDAKHDGRDRIGPTLSGARDDASPTPRPRADGVISQIAGAVAGEHSDQIRDVDTAFATVAQRLLALRAQSTWAMIG